MNILGYEQVKDALSEAWDADNIFFDPPPYLLGDKDIRHFGVRVLHTSLRHSFLPLLEDAGLMYDDRIPQKIGAGTPLLQYLGYNPRSDYYEFEDKGAKRFQEGS